MSTDHVADIPSNTVLLTPSIQSKHIQEVFELIGTCGLWININAIKMLP